LYLDEASSLADRAPRLACVVTDHESGVASSEEVARIQPLHRPDGGWAREGARPSVSAIHGALDDAIPGGYAEFVV
jgi:hypothetical protein